MPVATISYRAFAGVATVGENRQNGYPFHTPKPWASLRSKEKIPALPASGRTRLSRLQPIWQSGRARGVKGIPILCDCRGQLALYLRLGARFALLLDAGMDFDGPL